MRRLGAVLALALAYGCSREAETAIPEDADLTDLVALPYVSWTEVKVDGDRVGVTVYEPERA